jgi:hypothetical protein
VQSRGRNAIAIELRIPMKTQIAFLCGSAFDCFERARLVFKKADVARLRAVGSTPGFCG